MTGFLGTVLALLIAALGIAAARDRALLRSAVSARAIELHPAGTATVLLANGKRFEVRGVRGVGVTRHWVALAAVSAPGRSLLLTTAMLGAANARLLRLWALWAKAADVASGQRRP